MSSVKLFFTFLAESYEVFKKDFSVYLGSYIAFFLISMVGIIPWEGMGYEQNNFYEIISNVVVGILSLIVIVNVIMIEKAKAKNLEREKLMFAAPTYLIYTLYASLLMLAGFFCFIVPGIIAAVFVAMVPLASVLIDNDDINYFKISYRMARKDLVLVIVYGVVALLTELPSFLFDLIPNWQIKLGIGFIYSFFDSALLIIVTIASVRVFYHLKRALNDPS